MMEKTIGKKTNEMLDELREKFNMDEYNLDEKDYFAIIPNFIAIFKTLMETKVAIVNKKTPEQLEIIFKELVWMCNDLLDFSEYNLDDKWYNQIAPNIFAVYKMIKELELWLINNYWAKEELKEQEEQEEFDKNMNLE